MIITAHNNITCKVEEVKLADIYRVTLENIKPVGELQDMAYTVRLTIILWSGRAIEVIEPEVAILIIEKLRLHHAEDMVCSTNVSTETIYMNSPKRTIFI